MHAMRYIYIFSLTLFIVTCTIQTQRSRNNVGQVHDKLDSFRHELSAGRLQLDSMRVRLNTEIVHLKMSISSDKFNGHSDTIHTTSSDIIQDNIQDTLQDIAPDIIQDTTDIFNRQPDCHSNI